MDLRDITMDDLALYEDMVTDPAMMAELGGPLPRDGLKAKLRSIVDDVETGRIWYSVIVDAGVPAGTVCVWSHSREGEPINEIGWMVHTSFQGRGLATEAVGAYLERDRDEQRWGEIRAYPGVTNAASNAICRKTGFALFGETKVDYAGRMLRVNDWRIAT
ncbi:MAG: GNAT family N-acetyltransferase [Actinomycetota bacterium]